MNRFLFRFICVLTLIFLGFSLQAQITTVSTVPLFSNNNGNGQLSFNLQNTNNYDIIIRTIEGQSASTGSQTFNFWTHPTPLNGTGPAASVANGWTLAASGTYVGVTPATTTSTQIFLDNLAVVIPANSTIAVVMDAPQNYFTISANTNQTHSAGGVNILTGHNVSYGAGRAPTVPPNHPRGWLGKIHFEPASPCVNPPTPGISVASAQIVCLGRPVELSLSGTSGGMHQTYQWESSTTANGPWTAVSAILSNAIYSHTPTGNTYYRCKIVCSGGAPVYSTPVLVNVDANLMSGTYTINSGAPTAGTNFNSFAALVTRLECGINGPVVINVVPNSGPYNETVTFGDIFGTSAINTIRINGNGNTLQFDCTASNFRLITFDGTKRMTIDSLHIKTLNATYGWGVTYTNGAKYDSLLRCNIDLSTITGTSSANSNGIVISNSLTSPTTSGSEVTNIYIGNNLVNAGHPTSAGGAYYAMSLYGTSSSAGGLDSVYVINNEIKNFYYYGIQMYYSNDSKIIGNNIHKSSKTALSSSSYGISVYYPMGAEVANNRVHDFVPTAQSPSYTQYPIYLYYGNYYVDTRPTNVYNNAIYNVGNYGSTFYGIYAYYGKTVNIYHNTINANLSSPTGTGTMYGIYTSAISNLMNIKNNIVSITGGNSAMKYGIYNANLNSTPPDGFQNNTVYMASNQSGMQYRMYHNTPYSNLALLRADYPLLETTSADVNPYFLDANSGDLKPRNANIYRNGQNFTAIVPRDILGVLRTTTPTIGAFEMDNLPNNDLALEELLSPGNFCAGSLPITVKLTNHGSNSITSAVINWKINNVIQTPFAFTGNLASRASQDVVITPSYNFANGTVYNFEFIVASVNGSTDARSYNDSIITSRRSSMGGTYTINRALPTSGTNYNSITAFSNDLNAWGVCAPVIANVVQGSGPYVETVEFVDIPGSSAINTIRLNGNGETMQFNCTSANRILMTFNGTKHFTVDSLNMKTLNATYGWGVLYTNAAKYDSLINCNIDLSMITGTSSANSNGIVISASKTSPTSSGSGVTNIYIGNNIVNAGHPTSVGGAYYGMSLYGTSTAAGGLDSVYVINNEVKNFYYYGIYMYYSKNCKVLNNDVHKSTKTALTTSSYGYCIYYPAGMEFANNKVHDFTPRLSSSSYLSYPVYIYYPNYYIDDVPTNIYNNAVYNMGNYGSTFYGMYIYYGKTVNVYHNTVNVNLSTPTGTSTMYGIYIGGTNNLMNLKNNIVTFTGGNGGTKYGIYNSGVNSIVANGIQRNTVQMASSRTGTQYRIYHSSAYATLAAFRAAYPLMEVGTIDEDPQYFDAVNGDLTPGSINTLLNGEGLNAQVPRDINNSVRPVPPTPGAFDLAPKDYNNAGVDSFIAPADTFCAGQKQIRVRVRNYGINDITSVNVNWSINGVLQTAVPYTNTIDGTRTSGNNTAIVTLGSSFINYGLNYNIQTWTSDPNATIDDYNVDDTLTKVVTPSSHVDFNLGTDTTLCSNAQFQVSAGSASNTYTYRWDDNSVANTRIITLPGTYHVIKTHASTQCAGTDTIVIQHKPSPTVNLGPDVVICAGDSVILDAGAQNLMHQILWDNAQTSQFRTAKLADVYSVAVTAANGCTSVDEVEIIFKDRPITDGINAVYMLNATYNFNLIRPLYVENAVWDYGDGSPLDTGFNVTHTYARNGFYSVSVKLLSECGAESDVVYSETLDAIGLGVNKLDGDNTIVLFPNPSKDYVNIEIKGDAKIEGITIYNALGQAVYKTDVKSSSKTMIETSSLSSGMYNIQISTDKGMIYKKVDIIK